MELHSPSENKSELIFARTLRKPRISSLHSFASVEFSYPRDPCHPRLNFQSRLRRFVFFAFFAAKFFELIRNDGQSAVLLVTVGNRAR
jgi:hypothetical protein